MKATRTSDTSADARIVRKPGVMGGSPTIEGTRIRVADVVCQRELTPSAAGVRRAFPHLTKAQIDAAIDYYNRNKGEIDAYIAEEEVIHEELRQRPGSI